MQTIAKQNNKNNFFCKKNIPNILTILRIILVFVVFSILLVSVQNKGKIIYSFSIGNYPLHVYSNIFIAGFFFLTASITDALDGKLARKWSCVSDFGKIWDPIADKLLVNTTLIFFMYFQFIPTFIVVPFIIRDIIVDGFRMYASSKQMIVPANIFGKLKTVFQILAIIFIFFIFQSVPNDGRINYYLIQNLLIYLALFFSILSGIIYVVSINKKIKL